jgi:hypothetical protein
MHSGLAGRAFRALALLFACLSMCMFAVAQSTTDGAVGGTVFDSNGAVVPKAHVVAHNNATNADKEIDADDAGYYRIVGLQPGDYTVTVTAGSGFAAYKAEHVVVQVGSITDVSPRLKIGGGAETVNVTAEAPQINTTTPEFAPTINQTAISELPVNGGRWSNFSLLTPGVVSDQNAFGLLSFRGISSILNNNTIDGADNNQAFFSEERGRTRIGYSTPKASVQEFQVNTSNYSAEYGRSAGGVVNTVTKSGGNAYHGELYGYNRNIAIGAANPLTTIPIQTAPGVFTNTNVKPTDVLWNAGAGVGGPIVKDRLFFFFTYDYYWHNFPGVAVASNPNAFFAAPSAATISTLATRLGVTNAQATAIYNADFNAFVANELGNVPRSGEQFGMLPKLDWQVNQKNHVSLSFNRFRWASPNGIQTQAAVSRGVQSFDGDFVKENWGVAKLNSFFNPYVANELRYQYGQDFEYETTNPATPFEAANIVTGNAGSGANTPCVGNVCSVNGTVPGFVNPNGLPPSVSITNGPTIGVPTFLPRPKFPDERQYQIADTITWIHGNHTLKFGLDFRHVDDVQLNNATIFGSFSYSSLLNFFSDLNGARTCAGAPCYSTYSQALGPLGFELVTKDYAFFGQDDWKINPRLTLSLGMRWEYESLPKAFLANPDIPATNTMPSDTNNLGPRVGFAYQMTKDAKTVLRGGYGIYYGRVINSTIFSALTSTANAAGQQFFSISTSSAAQVPCAPTFPVILAAVPGCPGASKTAVYFDPNFQLPQIHQMDLTLEREVGWGTVISASYLGSMGRQLPTFLDTNFCFSAAQAGCSAATAPVNVAYTGVGGPLNGQVITLPVFTGRPTTGNICAPTCFAYGSGIPYSALTDIASGVNTSYNAGVLQVNHRFAHHLQFSAIYTWSHAIDMGQNQQTFTNTNSTLIPLNIAAEKGNSIYDIPHRFVLHAVMTSPWKMSNSFAKWFVNDWSLNPVYQIQSGYDYKLGTNGTPTGGVSSGPTGSNGDFRVGPPNDFHMRAMWLMNARLSKSFSFTERYKLELLTDFFNIANKQNIMGVVTTGYNVAGCAKTVACGAIPAGTGTLTFAPTFGNANSINNSNFLWRPREFQLGARIKF